MPVPKLTPRKLQAAARLLPMLPIEADVTREVMAVLLEAATPDRHSTDRLEGERGENVRATERIARSHTSAVLRRAAAGLRAISDDEWAALVKEAARENEIDDDAG